MEQVKNLDDKRVCDQSKDGKVIVIRKKDCITRITANADRTLKITHLLYGNYIKGQMQVGRFLVHVYHRRHDIFPSYPANEEVRRPLEKRLYLLWGFPLEKLRAGSYQRIDKPCAVLAGSAPGLFNAVLNEMWTIVKN